MSVEFVGMIATLDQSETRAAAGGPLVDREYVRRFARAQGDNLETDRAGGGDDAARGLGQRRAGA